MPSSSPPTSWLRRSSQVFAGLTLGFVIFAGLGELLARSLNLVDRLNGFPRQLYAATESEELPYVLQRSLDTKARGRRVVIDENRMRVANEPRTYPPDARRILVLGDSVAFGYRLPFEATLGAQLERVLDERTGRSHRVLNGGVEGYNTRNQLAWLREHGLTQNPEAIVVAFNLNDYDYGPVMGPSGVLTTDRNQRVSTWSLANLSDFYVLLRWLAKMGMQGLSAPPEAPTGDGPSAPDDTGQHFRKFDRFVSILRKRYYGEPTDERWERMVAALGGLRDEAAARGIPLLIAIIPDGDQIAVANPNMIPQQRLETVCQQERLNCLDLAPSFEAEAGEESLFIDIMHPNAEGHAIIARKLADRFDGAPE